LTFQTTLEAVLGDSALALHTSATRYGTYTNHSHSTRYGTYTNHSHSATHCVAPHAGRQHKTAGKTVGKMVARGSVDVATCYTMVARVSMFQDAS